MKSYLKALMVIALLLTIPTVAFSYQVPRDNSKAQYFYLFGPEGNPLDGKESDEFELSIDVPESSKEDVVIEVFDPNTGGDLDAGVSPWNTQMEFSVEGESLLGEEVFGDGPQYDGKSYKFGPYAKTKGRKIGDKYRFTLTAKALKGDDLNLFNVRISPDSAESFSNKFTFVLLPPGQSIYFYPEIPAGISKVIVRNFDLDKDGGVSTLRDSLTGERFPIKDSESGQWTETEIPLDGKKSRRLEYKVTTTHQTRGHAGLEIRDEKGKVIPIYFRKGAYVAPEKPAPAPKKEPSPALACNQFTFDARDSFDAEKNNLTYEWNFGDGTTSNEPYVTHTYEKGGAYKVTLTVSDNSGLQCEKSSTVQDIQVNTPPQAAFSAPELVCAGEKVSLDAGASTDDNPGELSYQWNFGDGTSATDARVTKVFDRGGVYEVSLNVNDNAGSSCSADAAKRVIRVNTPPVAKAGKPVSMCLRNPEESFKVNFDASGSADSDRDGLSYLWNFGDGSKAEGIKVQHEFKDAGDYTAKLTVTDSSGSECASSTDSVPVSLNRAPLAVAGKDQHTCTGKEVTFDASSSYVEEESSAVYRWNFGDGETGTGKTVTHKYAKGGNYPVTLTIDDGKESECSQSVDSFNVRVNSRPQAVLNDAAASCVGNQVSFDASASKDADGDSLKYIWDFGDGTTQEGGSKVSHQYSKGGSYRVSVKVDDGTGAGCSTAMDNVDIKINTPPVANTGPNLACCTEESTQFDGSGSKDADGDELSYRWSFGDGGTSSEAKTDHAYSKSGAYKVVLTVDDNSGTTCSTSSSGFTADVNSQPVPVIKIKQK